MIHMRSDELYEVFPMLLFYAIFEVCIMKFSRLPW